MVRGITRLFKGIETVEGAGVRLSRIFGSDEAVLTDPFLLLDHFGSEDPRDYVAGFPWHPHRGIETITYLVNGVVEHEDSLGNKGSITSGDIQWMTAGKGIIHKEMPLAQEGELIGFQLWLNLPADHKLTMPKYRDLKASDIPVVAGETGKVRVISGEFNGTQGAARDLTARPRYLDISLEKNNSMDLHAREGETVIIYVFEGTVMTGDDNEPVSKGQGAILGNGSLCRFTTKDAAARFLFMSASPYHEPIAWRGSIVMNTEQELAQAYKDYFEGLFI